MAGPRSSMMPRRGIEIARGVVATLLVVLVGSALLWHLTGGLHFFTSEAWRRAQVEAAPRPLPDVVLQDSTGRTVRLRALCTQPLLIDFIYTSCTSVCRAMGASMAQLAVRLEISGPQQPTVLSISFDPVRDTPARLGGFKRGLDPSTSAWRVMRPVDGVDALLRTFGVVVIPDGHGGFEHNAGLHGVDRSCRLTRIFDIDEVADAERWLLAHR